MVLFTKTHYAQAPIRIIPRKPWDHDIVSVYYSALLYAIGDITIVMYDIVTIALYLIARDI